MKTTLEQLIAGQWFIISLGGRAYEYIGKTVNGRYIYRDSDLKLYDKLKNTLVYMVSAK